MNYPSLTQEEKNRILQFHVQGKTAPEIAKTVKRNNSTIYGFLKKNGMSPLSKPDRFTESQKEEMRERYLIGDSLKVISERFNCSRETVKHRLVKMGVTIRPKNEKINLPAHIIKKIVDAYQHERCSTYELAERYKISPFKVTTILKEQNVEIHPVGQKYTKEVVDEVEKLAKLGLIGKEIAEKLNVSEAWICQKLKEREFSRERGPRPKIKRTDYFDHIDTEDKAYFLGLLVADGYIYEKDHSIRLILQHEDSDAVLGFTLYIGAEGRNNYFVEKQNLRWKDKYAFRGSSKHMYHSLQKLGVVQGKSGKEVMPDLPDHLIPHFIRGYFDGDGLTCPGPSRKYSGFCGSKGILTSIQYHLGTTLTLQEGAGEIYKFTGGVGFSRVLYDYLYAGANIWLNRKRRRMDEICGYSSEWPENHIVPIFRIDNMVK
ncbi:hypothetical protein GCM10007216_18630 [Thalassobacillus devorans]|uniref:DOD-type homing endonuclease domain-containing protein n=1 Tax=Thalassobacillus devorans TaxID=279813 RepID=A0ABQ1P058_9BACI|nr:helix-turn-helix domain-containing protein [Thalassobacillus devorans]NIK28194.1 DNA-binding CsgD family transcriptional regulator [Thalassobacillus devorans]GGC88169.1 hypothetical protein GCM10007216_18630 [Thalassobacillus devorans]